jgi:type IV pilus assembly protein PilC
MAFQIENIANVKKTTTKKSVDSSFLKKEITLFGKSFSNKIKEDFFTELSVLLKAGIQLKDALELIKDSIKKKQNQATIEVLTSAIIQGKSLSDAIKDLKEFNNYEFYSLKIGEETGTLGQVTEQLGTFYTRKNEQRRELINALTYPMIILTTAVLVVVFMLQFVVPMFQDIFKQQNVELPAITKFIVSASEFVKSYGILFISILLIPVIMRSLFNTKAWYKRIKGKLILRIPYLGSFVKTVYLSQFTQAVTLLTTSKVPVVNSIHSC